MSDRYERLRQSYRPERVGVLTKVLMVGESRPYSGEFFYCTDSNLFFKTRDAFKLTYGETVRDGTDFLRQFQGNGFYLVDLCGRPVNRGMTDDERETERGNGERRLRRELGRLSPNTDVVVVMKAIMENVKRAARNRPDLVLRPPLPFPRPEHASRYVREMAEFLRRNCSFMTR